MSSIVFQVRYYCPFTSSEPTLSVKDSFQLSKSPNSSSEDSHGGQSSGPDSESRTCISDEGVEDCDQGLLAMEEEALTEKGWKEVNVATILSHPKLPTRSSLRYCRATILCFVYVIKVTLVLSLLTCFMKSRLFLILLAGIRFFPLGLN